MHEKPSLVYYLCSMEINLFREIEEWRANGSSKIPFYQYPNLGSIWLKFYSTDIDGEFYKL